MKIVLTRKVCEVIRGLFTFQVRTKLSFSELLHVWILRED
jgi:hypothetical protein